MKRTALVTALACWLALPVAADAQVEKQLAAPVALPAAKRLLRVNTALKKMGVRNISALKPFLGVRVTPLAPQWASNAKITFVGPAYYHAPAAGAPHGAYLLVQSTVRLTFPTEVGVLQVLDCRVNPIGSDTYHVKVKRAGAADVSPPVEDGHLLHVFQPTKAQTDLELVFNLPTSFPASAHFYGCELGKAGG